jgi:UPF0755 protein
VGRFVRGIVAAAAALLIVLAVLAAGAAFALYGDRSLPARETSVVVPDGATGSEIARLLENGGVIRSALAFRALERLCGAESAAKSGEYRFAPHLTPDEVLRRIESGGAQVATWVTIPEGFTASEIAQSLARHGLGETPALEAYFLHQPFEPVPGQRAPNLEGYLFPDTYLMPLQATPAALAAIMTGQFRRELPPDALARSRLLGFSVPQIVTIASLIEREAKADDERALMAGVYYNRLHRGMPLQVDATLEYTFAHHKTIITAADLARDTPYNSYLHNGLPPTPIANPGKPSLYAAFHPQASPFLYYVYKGNGHHAFSRTLAEHEANVARYLR